MEDDYFLLKLDMEPSFPFYAASRALTRVYRAILDPLGLTYPQYLVMLALFETNDPSVSEIGERLMLDSGTVTPVLKRLEAMGLVEKVRSSADERVVQVRLTEKGQGLQGQLLDTSNKVDCIIGLQTEEAREMRLLVMSVINRITTEDTPNLSD